jgi:hypothetical protein
METRLKSRYDRCIRLLFIGLCCCLMASTGFGQEPSDPGRRQFYDIAELIRLIERAREAGMTDEELHQLEIRDGDRIINVMEYKAEFERLQRLKEERLKAFLSKQFLTVNDIFQELIVTEPDVIRKLREELVSDR